MYIKRSVLWDDWLQECFNLYDGIKENWHAEKNETGKFLWSVNHIFSWVVETGDGWWSGALISRPRLGRVNIIFSHSSQRVEEVRAGEWQVWPHLQTSLDITHWTMSVRSHQSSPASHSPRYSCSSSMRRGPWNLIIVRCGVLWGEEGGGLNTL